MHVPETNSEKASEKDNNLLLTDSQIEELQNRLIQEITDFVKGLAREGERAAVVLGAARLDVALELLLKKLMHHHPGGSDNLFEPDRPLGSFSAKIALAYRLGVIDSNFEHALQMIRKIRNAFAHSTTVSSLSDPPHSSQLNELVRDVRKNGDFFDSIAQGLGQLGFPSKLIDFCAAVVVLLMALEMVKAVSVQLQPIQVARLDKKRFLQSSTSQGPKTYRKEGILVVETEPINNLDINAFIDELREERIREQMAW